MFRNGAIFNFVIMLFPMVFGIMFVCLIPLAKLNPMIFLNLLIISVTIGFTLFFSAKLSLIKKGIFFSFGTSEMGKKHKIYYFSGYGFIFLGFLLSVSLVAALKLSN